MRLDEIELLLGIGQQRPQLADDVDGARRAGANAPLLAGIDDPAYLNLRQTLAQEQAAMEALGADPRPCANALLEKTDDRRAGRAEQARTQRRARPWYERRWRGVIRVQPTAGSGLQQRPDREAALRPHCGRNQPGARDRTSRRRRAFGIALAPRHRRRAAAPAGRFAGLPQKRRVVAELRDLRLRADSCPVRHHAGATPGTLRGQ